MVGSCVYKKKDQREESTKFGLVCHWPMFEIELIM